MCQRIIFKGEQYLFVKNRKSCFHHYLCTNKTKQQQKAKRIWLVFLSVWNLWSPASLLKCAKQYWHLICRFTSGIAFPVAVTALPKFLWLEYIGFSITIQPRLTMLGPHIEHGGYMSGTCHLILTSFSWSTVRLC